MIDPIGNGFSAHITTPTPQAQQNTHKQVAAASGGSGANLQGNTAGHPGTRASMPKVELPRAPLTPGTVAGPAPAFTLSVLEARSRPQPSIPLPLPEEAAQPVSGDAGPAPAKPAHPPEYHGFSAPPEAPQVNETI